MRKQWRRLIISIVVCLIAELVIQPTPGFTKAVTKQQTQAIQQRLKQANANAIVLVG